MPAGEWVVAAWAYTHLCRALVEAADKLCEQPYAVQLRQLQTLQSIAAQRNSTIVVPVPRIVQQVGAAGIHCGRGTQIYLLVDHLHTNVNHRCISYSQGDASPFYKHRTYAQMMANLMSSRRRMSKSDAAIVVTDVDAAEKLAAAKAKLKEKKALEGRALLFQCCSHIRPHVNIVFIMPAFSFCPNFFTSFSCKHVGFLHHSTLPFSNYPHSFILFIFPMYSCNTGIPQLPRYSRNEHTRFLQYFDFSSTPSRRRVDIVGVAVDDA